MLRIDLPNIHNLQKKGWLGVPLHDKWGNGKPDFISRLLANCRNPSIFYSEYLSKLFFETLNQPRPDDLAEIIPGEKTRVPYLNGGLFEEDDPNQRGLIFEEELFKKLFAFFDQYNFTIYEDDPNDHTVAVDPEMLGHIFENLLEDNKDKGAFYTPKEIVHYMCQESLIEYLTTWFEGKNYHVQQDTFISFDNAQQASFLSVNEGHAGQSVLEIAQAAQSNSKIINRSLIEKLLKKQLSDDDKKAVIEHAAEFNEALDKVKVCDPAIGSGAFPMGLLLEIFTAKQTIHTFTHGDLTTFEPATVKLNIIQNSIYGVDIERGAVDIARLRFWLSLVVDEPEPQALPNLDYKIVVGNSLISKLGDDVIEIDWEIKPTNHGLFGAEEAKSIKNILKQLTELQKNFFKPNAPKKSLAPKIRNLKIELLIQQLNLMIISGKAKEHKPSGNKNSTVAKTQHDLKIANYKNKINSLEALKTKPEQALEFFDWQLNFAEVMNKEVSENGKIGFDIVIGNPPYINIKNQSEETRSVLKNNFNLSQGADIYVGFLEVGFQLLKENQPLAYIIPNKFFGADYGKLIRKEINAKKSILAIWDLKDVKVFENAQISTIVFICSDKRPNYKTKIKTLETIIEVDNVFDQGNKIQIESTDSDKAFLSKIFKITVPLNQVAEVRTGVMGFEYWKMEPIINSLGAINDDNVPIYTNGNCNRYEDNWETKEITLYKNKYSAPTVSLDPNYLNRNTIELFKTTPKIIVRGVSQKVAGFIDNRGSGLLVAVHSIIPKKINLNLLLSIINSKFINWYHLKTFYAIRIPQGSLKYPVEFFNSLPIPANLVNNTYIEDLVENIILNRSKNKDSNAFEQKIDNVIYKLYKLSFDEVKIIDPDFALSETEYNSIVI